MRSFHSKCRKMCSHRVKEFSEKLNNLKISDYHGLTSPGLTCYLNSVLQVLFMTEDFREAVKRCSIKHSTTLDPYLSQLFIHLERHEANTSAIINKLGITDVLKQRDASEYFEKILCLTSPDSSMVFRGELNHWTRCCACKSKNDSKNFFWVLPLAVENSNHKACNVQQDLENFFNVQTMSGANQMYCNICDKKQDADTGCEMIQSPDVLTLLLKRFTFDYMKNYYVKLKCEADVTQTVHIQKHKYDLYAVVHHFGDLSGGHYTADIRSFETGQWYCFNDQVVKMLKPQHFEDGNLLRSRTAYLLMYKKANGRSKKPESSDLETHRALSGSMDKKRTDKVDVESFRGRNKKHLNGDYERLLRNEISSRRSCEQLDQRRHVLFPAFAAANGQYSGNKYPPAAENTRLYNASSKSWDEVITKRGIETTSFSQQPQNKQSRTQGGSSSKKSSKNTRKNY